MKTLVTVDSIVSGDYGTFATSSLCGGQRALGVWLWGPIVSFHIQFTLYFMFVVEDNDLLASHIAICTAILDYPSEINDLVH